MGRVREKGVREMGGERGGCRRMPGIEKISGVWSVKC
jgi:hypothetical protein